MNSVSDIIGSNIKKLMEQHNMNINELSSKIGVTRQTMSKYISGESVIDSEKLFILANVFNTSIMNFINQDYNDLSFMFRAHDPERNFDMYQKNRIEMLMSRVDEAYKLAGDILSYIPQQYKIHVELKGKRLPDEVEKLLERIAMEQRELLDVGEATGEELVRCFEVKGIKVIFEPLNDLNLFGISAFNEQKGSFIVVNDDNNIPEERKLFSMIHEYAHLLFHRELYKKSQLELNYSNYIDDVNEKVANSFAGYFLIPRDFLAKYDYILKEKITYRDLFTIKKEFKVSLSALVYSLIKYGYIKNSRHLWDNLKVKGYMKHEPEPIERFPKNTKYEYIVKKLFLNEKIGVNKVAEFLNIKIAEARTKTNEWKINEEEI